MFFNNHILWFCRDNSSFVRSCRKAPYITKFVKDVWKRMHLQTETTRYVIPATTYFIHKQLTWIKSITIFLNLKLPRGILICHQWLLSNHSLQLVGTYYPSRSSLIFFKLSLPSLAVNGSQLSTGCPLYSIGNNGFLHRSPWKPWDSPQTSSLNWNKFPCCLWRIAKHFRHRRKIKGIFFNSPVSLPCSFSHVSY